MIELSLPLNVAMNRQPDHIFETYCGSEIIKLDVPINVAILPIDCCTHKSWPKMQTHQCSQGLHLRVIWVLLFNLAGTLMGESNFMISTSRQHFKSVVDGSPQQNNVM